MQCTGMSSITLYNYKLIMQKLYFNPLIIRMKKDDGGRKRKKKCFFKRTTPKSS